MAPNHWRTHFAILFLKIPTSRSERPTYGKYSKCQLTCEPRRRKQGLKSVFGAAVLHQGETIRIINSFTMRTSVALRRSILFQTTSESIMLASPVTNAN